MCSFVVSDQIWQYIVDWDQLPSSHSGCVLFESHSSFSLLDIDTERLALQGVIVRAGTSATRTSNDACGTPVTLYQSLVNDWIEFICDPSVVARYVFVEIPSFPAFSQLTLCEVKVWQCGTLPGGNQQHISSLFRFNIALLILIFIDTHFHLWFKPVEI